MGASISRLRNGARAAVSIATGVALGCAALSVAAANPTIVDISSCMAIPDAKARASCYDSLADAARRSAARESSSSALTSAAATAVTPNNGNVPGKSPAAVASTPANLPPAQPDVTVGSFGKESARVVQKDDGRRELHDTVSQLKQSTGDTWLVTLASGQVWRQTVPERFNLHQGDEVRIFPSEWGNSFRLSSASLHGFIQVERLK